MFTRHHPACQPTLPDRLPNGEGWVSEFDGHRMKVHKAGAHVMGESVCDWQIPGQVSG